MNDSKYKKRKRVFSYLFFGVLTTLINIFVYRVLLNLQVDYRISNLAALVVCKIAVYITNKLFVFQSHCSNKKELLKEMLNFILARSGTGLVDYFGLIFLVQSVGIGQIYAKYLMQVIVIILNYFFSQKLVFRACSLTKNVDN